MAVTWNEIREIALKLPGMVDGTSYGTPALKLGKTFFTRLRHEDGAIVIGMPIDERDMLMQAAPDIYFITGHYASYPAVLIRLSAISRAEMEMIVKRRWRELAPKKLRDTAT